MEEILKFLIDNLDQSERIAKRNTTKICKYDDIKSEFLIWKETNKFDHSKLIINGYSAKMISDLAPFLNGVGVYCFMVTLRDDPLIAEKIISEKFPRK